VARRNAENQRGTLDVTLQRLEGGRGTALDSERARAQLSATLADIPTLEAAIAAARYRLGVLTGRDASVCRRSAPPTAPARRRCRPTSPPPARAAARTRSCARSCTGGRTCAAPSSRSRRARRSSARRGREYLPRLSIGGASGYTSSALDRFGNVARRASRSARWCRGRRSTSAACAPASTRRARRGGGAAAYEGAVLRAVGEVETSLSAYRRSRERLAQLDAAAAASARAAELARLRFTEGASDFLQVLDAERTLLEAQDRRAAGRADASARLVTLYRALGGAWPGDR
jgi:outer membrane protein TolC